MMVPKFDINCAELRKLNRTNGPGLALQLFQRKRVIMPAGVVKWFKPTIGYGFIQPDDGGKDAFVHISTVERAAENLAVVD